jgi:hypothetical protein
MIGQRGVIDRIRYLMGRLGANRGRHRLEPAEENPCLFSN